MVIDPEGKVQVGCVKLNVGVLTVAIVTAVAALFVAQLLLVTTTR